MAGVKGRSGGPRPNSGGARPGAGRKPKPAVLIDGRDPLAFLLDVMQGLIEPSPAQLKAATAAAKFMHAPKAPSGKKESKNDAAAEVAGGKFRPGAAPRLAAVNGKSVEAA